MLKIKLIPSSLFAVLVISTFMSGSASAFSYLVAGSKLTGAEEETVKSSGGPATFQAIGMEMICEEANGTDIIKAGGNSIYHFLLTTCRVERPANCTVHEAILWSGEDHLALTNPGVLLVQLLSPHGIQFSLTFLGANCSIAGTQAVEGIAGAEVVGGETAKTVGELSFVNTSSTFTLAGVKASLKLQLKQELSGAHKGALWAAMME